MNHKKLALIILDRIPDLDGTHYLSFNVPTPVGPLFIEAAVNQHLSGDNPSREVSITECYYQTVSGQWDMEQGDVDGAEKELKV
jgi:hypothetical protein